MLGGADPDALAPSLHDVLLARAEHLSDDARHVLRMVSAAGSWAPDELVVAVASLDEERLYAALRETVEQQLLIVHASGRGYAFRHSLARDALYEDLLPGERVRLHAAFGKALDEKPELAGSELEAASMLAYHWHAAHDTRRALAASITAGRQAAETFAPSEAQRHFERALELWPSCPDAAAMTGMDVIELGRLAAEAAQHGGAVERALSLLDEALLTLGADGDRVRRAALLEVRATVLRDLGRGHEAVEDARKAVALLPEDPPSAARARVLSVLAQLDIHGDDMPSAVRDAERAVAAALAAGETRSLADARVTLGAGTIYLGEAERGLAILREGLVGAEGDAYTEVRAYANLADALGLMGRHEEAVEAATRGMAVAERVGLARTGGAFVTVNRLESLLSLGRWDEADAVLAPGMTGRPGRRVRSRHVRGPRPDARAPGPVRGSGGRSRARAPPDRRPPRQHPVHAADGVRAGGDRPGARRATRGP